MRLLRENLLVGRRLVLGGEVPAPVVGALREHGAELAPLPFAELSPDDDRLGEWARSHAPLHALVWGGAGAFEEGGLDATLEQAWATVREVATGALIPARAPAKLLLVAPRPGAGPLADAARAGLESLVRTLSVEWARYGLTSVLIAPGDTTTDEQLAQLVCFVVSGGGEYLSGCRIELGAVGTAAARCG